MKAVQRPGKSRLRFANLLWALAVSLMTGALASPVYAQGETKITLGGESVERVIIAPGHTMTIKVNIPYSDIVVGNADVADVFPLSDTSLYIQGNKSGFTNISIFDPSKKLLGVIDVRVRINYAELRQAIRMAVPNANVEVANINNRIRVSGEVKDAVDLRRVLAITEQYSSESIINSIRIQDAQQVLLKVRILEVQRNSGRALGVDLVDPDSDKKLINTGQNKVSALSQPFGTFISEVLQIAGVQVDVVINALETKGLARRLANPSLVTTSGVEANFVVGGEVPISATTTGSDGTVSTQTSYREYGVRLNFKPTVLDDGLIKLRIRPEVSEIDTSVDVNGNPGFITRRADTTVNLRDGQSFAIAGLLQVDNSRTIKQLPWLGQIPVLGALLSSRGFQKKETDLVIVITPSIVRPAAPGQPLHSPLDHSRSSDDVELFLLGMMEVNKDMIRAFHDGAGVVGPYGHIIDLEFEDGLVKK